MFENLGLPALAAVGAMAAAGWQHVRSASRYITGALLVQKDCDEDVTRSIVLHLRQRYKHIRSGVSEIHAIHEYIDSNQHTSLVPFELPTKSTVWYGARGVFMLSGDNQRRTLVSIRGLGNPLGLICDACDDSDARIQNVVQNNYFVTRVMGTAGIMDLGGLQKNRALSSDNPEPRGLVSESSSQLPHRLIDKSFRFERERFTQNASNRDPFRGLFYQQHIYTLIDELKRWYDQRSWYQDHGIPWRTGVLLHGPGGTGKSSLARAVAQMIRIPIYQYFLSTLTDREFVDQWNDMQTPCVVALEDFDTVFHGRENVTIHKSLSFECLLNQISGISSVNGVLLFVSTNYLEHIDPAMGQLDSQGRPTRPGRIDRIVHLGLTDEYQRRRIAEYTLKWAGSNLIDFMIGKGDGTTAAQFQSQCLEVALAETAILKEKKHDLA